MTIIVAISAVLIIGVLFVVARRALRFVVRLALVGMLILFLLIGGLVWWYGTGSSPASKPYGGSPSGTRRTTSR